jgi:hypothetical protein
MTDRCDRQTEPFDSPTKAWRATRCKIKPRLTNYLEERIPPTATEANVGIEEIFRYAMSFLGGGMVVAILTWIKEARSAVRQQEVAYLKDQFHVLYAPLHCLTVQNMETFKHTEKLRETLHQNIKVESQDPIIPPVTGAEAGKIIEMSSAYMAKITENNTRIRQLLEANWSLIDLEDEEVFVAFLTNCLRMQVEIDEHHAERVPLRVVLRLGDIYYLNTGFLERVTAQWKAKRVRLEKLRTLRRWPWSKR